MVTIIVLFVMLQIKMLYLNYIEKNMDKLYDMYLTKLVREHYLCIPARSIPVKEFDRWIKDLQNRKNELVNNKI